MNNDSSWSKNFKNLAKEKFLLTLDPSYNQFKTYTNILLQGKNKKVSKICLKVLKKNVKNDSWAWIELKNSAGEPGWLFGSADFITFETKTEFVFVARSKLVDFVFQNVNFKKPFARDWWLAKNKICQRKGKEDQISLIKISDLKTIKNTYIWKK